MLKAFLVNYNYTPTWLLESDLDWHLVDRSDSKEYLKDFPQERITYEPNFGQVDYPKLMFLYEQYDNLPDYFLWSKSNLFKSITEEEWDKVKHNKTFTPLLTQNHRTYADPDGNQVCYYQDGMYHERIGIIDSMHEVLPWRHAKTFSEFTYMFKFPCPDWIPFAPGGNYILTKECVHKYGRDVYKAMADLLPYASNPLEAQFCERSYYNIWK